MLPKIQKTDILPHEPDKEVWYTMAQKKEDLPINVDVDLQNGGTITYANEVLSIIAGVAANEVEGIAGMCVSGGLSDIIGRNRNVTRGVKVEIGAEEVSVDLYVIVEYGKPIQRVCHDVQENVRKSVESMTGLHVVKIDVHVQGVSFEQEKKTMQSSIEASKNLAIAAPEKKNEEVQEPQKRPNHRKKSSSKQNKEAEPQNKPEKEEEPAPTAESMTEDKTSSESETAPEESGTTP